jgi:hypothetical protein
MKKPSPERADPTYDVGYKKPPRANQFRKGRSGNPRGRKSGDENLLSVFKRIAQQRVKINDAGKIRTISMADAVILQNYKAALQKDQSAMSNLFRLAEEAGELVDRTDPKQVGKPGFFPRRMSMEEWLKRHPNVLAE